jgi:hypothetical protein
MFYNFREFHDYYILFVIWMFFQILGKKSFVFGCQYLEVLSIIYSTYPRQMCSCMALASF